MLREHRTAGVEVHLFFDDECEAMDLPSSLEHDWVLIDEGSLVGAHDRDTKTVTWFAGNKQKSADYLAHWEELLSYCEYWNAAPLDHA
jgi:hypothetical protein